jgi:3-keto-5-aminohexanoate cleavage enzyme
MAAKSDKVIISCAITGAIHTPTMSDALPITPDQIASQAIGAAEAGAAILHLHARNPQDGRPIGDPAVFMQFLPRIKQATDAVVNITTGGSPTMPVEERLAGVMQLSPEMCSLNMGLLNFFIRGEQVFFANHRSDIERFAREIAARDVKPELEVYSAAMLEEVAHLLSLGILSPPYVINLVFHTPTQGGTRGTPENLLDAVARIRTLGEDVQINVSSMGPTQLPLTTIALAMGLNIRVGMEDNVLYRRGEPLRDNAQLVERAVRIARELDREPATPAQARELLGLRGR